VTALLEALAAIKRQIARLDEQLKGLARRLPVCWRLMGVSSVRPWRCAHAAGRGHKPAPSKAQRRSLSAAYDQMLPIQPKGRGAWHSCRGGKDAI